MNRTWNRIKQNRLKYKRFYGRFKSDSNKFIIKHKTEDTQVTNNTTNSLFIELGNYLRITWYDTRFGFDNPSYSLISTTDDNKTMTEDLIDYLSNTKGISDEQIRLFTDLIKEQRYDTESILMDIKQGNSSQCNLFTMCSIYPTAASPLFENMIQTYFQHQERMFLHSVYVFLLMFLVCQYLDIRFRKVYPSTIVKK